MPFNQNNKNPFSTQTASFSFNMSSRPSSTTPNTTSTLRDIVQLLAKFTDDPKTVHGVQAATAGISTVNSVLAIQGALKTAVALDALDDAIQFINMTIPSLEITFKHLVLTDMASSRAEELLKHIGQHLRHLRLDSTRNNYVELAKIAKEALDALNIPDDLVLKETYQKLSDMLPTIKTDNDNIPFVPPRTTDEHDIAEADRTSPDFTRLESDTIIDAEVKNFRNYLRTQPPPSSVTRLSPNPPSTFHTLDDGKEKDPRIWRLILDHYWSVVKPEETAAQGVPVRVQQEGRSHAPVFVGRTNFAKAYIYGPTKKAIALAIVNGEFD